MKKLLITIAMFLALPSLAFASFTPNPNPQPISSTAEGSTSDSAATNSTSSWSMVAMLKGLYSLWTSGVTGQAANSAVTAVTNGTPINIMARTDGAQVVQIGATPEMVYNIANTMSTTSLVNLAVGTTGKRLGLNSLCMYNRDTVAHVLTISNGSNDIGYISAPAATASCLVVPQGLWVSINTNIQAKLDAATTTTNPTVVGQAYFIGAD